MIVYWPGYHYIEIALMFEVIVIVLAILLSILLHYFYAGKKKRTSAIQGKLHSLFTQILSEQLAYKIELFSFRGVKLPHVVTVIRKMNEKVMGTQWDQLKGQIAIDILKPQLARYLHSRHWEDRAYTLQALELLPSSFSEDKILPYLNDPIPIIRINAVKAAIHLKSKKAIDAVIETMAREESFARYPYRDDLLRADATIYTFLVERLVYEKDPQYRACCLEILSQKVGYVNLEILKDDLTSPLMHLRWWAIRALENYPTKESVEHLIRASEDPEWQIQALAVRCLGLFGHQSAVPILEKKLSDDQWLVRVNAALALRSVGQEGIQVLKNAVNSDNALEAETAEYALKLPEIPLGNENIKWLDLYPMGFQK